MDNTTMLSVHELAVRWGVSAATIRKSIRLGHVAAITLGHACVRIPLDEVLRAERARPTPSAGVEGGGA